jgi:hypothetical protein
MNNSQQLCFGCERTACNLKSKNITLQKNDNNLIEIAIQIFKLFAHRQHSKQVNELYLCKGKNGCKNMLDLLISKIKQIDQLISRIDEMKSIDIDSLEDEKEKKQKQEIFKEELKNFEIMFQKTKNLTLAFIKKNQTFEKHKFDFKILYLKINQLDAAFTSIKKNIVLRGFQFCFFVEPITIDIIKDLIIWLFDCKAKLSFKNHTKNELENLKSIFLYYLS